jgi:RNA polymerase sigma factor (sigma-70 family)
MDDEGRWQRLIEGLRGGDRQVAREFCEQYWTPLQRIAAKYLPANVRRRVGPEDVVQSACRTFFRRVEIGEFQLADSESLWRLLCAITLTKVREQSRFHLRKRRDIGQETSPDSSTQIKPASEAVDPGPTPAEAAEFVDQFQSLIGSLEEEERQIVDLKLQEFTNEQTAERLGCSERTVRRVLKRIQAQLARILELP